MRPEKEQQLREIFAKNTADHQLSILHDDGPYRHLRMSAPDSQNWRWDIITWPGHLSVAGQIADGYTFAREYDMLTFFHPEKQTDQLWINPVYWSGKLSTACRDSARRYDQDEFLAQLNDHLTESMELGEMNQAEVDEVMNLASTTGNTNHEAHEWLAEFLRDQDTWEWDLTEFSPHFIYTCLAIAATVRAYAAAQNATTDNTEETS